MPIQFTCPKCNASMTVKDAMAGKSGKCKCGNTITVPAAKAAPAPAVGDLAVGNALDELVDSDFNRESPMNKVYGAKESTNDRAALSKFEGEEAKEQRAKSNKMNVSMIAVAIVNFILAIGLFVLLGMVAAEAGVMKDIGGFVPETKFSKALCLTFFGVSALVLIAGGVGLLLQQSWGWVISAFVLVVGIVERIAAFVVLVLAGDFSQAKFFIGAVPLFALFGLAMVVFKEDNRRIFKIRDIIPVAIAVFLGVACSGGLVGLMFSEGLFSSK